MLDVIGQILTPAVGVAISPVPIIAVILMLSTPKARSNGSAFAIGWVAALVAVSLIVLLVVGDTPTEETTTGVGWVKLVFGLLFLAIGFKQWRSRPRGDQDPEMPKWMQSIDGFTSGRSLAVGVALAGVNPKNLAMTFAAAAIIAEAGLSGSETTLAVGVFVIIASLTVAGPVLYYLLSPTKASATLAEIKDFMSRNNAVIMTVLMAVLGTKLIGDALSRLG